MPSEVNVQCPHCSESVVFTRGKTGKWVGRVVGGVMGGWIGGSLGIAGAVFGIVIGTVATIPAAVLGWLAGDNIGGIFSKVACPECGEKIK